MRRQAEIVVRREVDDGPAVEVRRGLLAIVENAQRAIEALLTQRVELSVEEGKRIGAHWRQYKHVS